MILGVRTASEATSRRNRIALLSNFEKPSLDRPARRGAALRATRVKVRTSQDHVDETYDPAFLDLLRG
jgi:hypothetical protein